MRGRLALSVCLALKILLSCALAQEPSRPKGALNPRDEGGQSGHGHKSVKVVLLKSWGAGSVWEDLKTNWSDYGKTPLVIDDSTFVNSDFTYQDIVDSKANVLVLSNPSGGMQTYSEEEVSAVATYAAKGHPVLGTYEVFQFSNIDNRALAPIFGLNPTLQYDNTPISNLFDKIKQDPCLFRQIPGGSWQSYGYASSQIPASGNWTGNLYHATAEAESDSYVGVITTYKAKKYTGLFISNFPEYYGGMDDEQLLYNASTCYAK
jgi:hypothetical protein